MVKDTRPSRADYYKVLAKAVPAGTLVVTALGNASYLWAAMHHVPENFYIEDSMGLALPLALGLAVAQPSRRVVVVEGDGATLMHMGALVTVGAAKPANLTVLLIQNGVHAASGGQALTNPALDLAALARAAGIDHAMNVAHPKALVAALGESAEGPRLFCSCDCSRYRSCSAADRVRPGAHQATIHDRDWRASLRSDAVRRRQT